MNDTLTKVRLLEVGGTILIVKEDMVNLLRETEGTKITFSELADSLEKGETTILKK